MQGKSLVPTIVFGLSLAIFATEVLAQQGGRGRGGRGGMQPEAEGGQAPMAGRGPGGGGQAGGRFGGGQAANPLFAALDVDGDGVITTLEMEDAIQAFAKLDENKDGKLTAEEAGAAGSGRGHMHGGAAAGGSSQTPGVGRGGQGGRAGAGESTPKAGRGGRRPGGPPAGSAGGRGAAQPVIPPADQENSKSPFEGDSAVPLDIITRE